MCQSFFSSKPEICLISANLIVCESVTDGYSKPVLQDYGIFRRLIGLWRVTLISIHVGEVRVIPRRMWKDLEKILQRGLRTGCIKSIELDQRIMCKMSKEIYEQIR